MSWDCHSRPVTSPFHFPAGFTGGQNHNIMPSFNKTILVGNLTRDPETRYTPKGTAICQIGLAINRSWKTESGEKKEDVVFIDCKAFGKSAETLAQYTRKGRPLLIEGRLDVEEWEDKTSKEKRRKTVVIVESFQFLGDAPKQEVAGD